MRVTGGIARGIPLVGGARNDVRPATDMMRQAVFSSLGARIEGLSCLDLFAGTGAYGLDALSRGAASVRFVEQDREAIRAIGQNVQAVCKSMKAGTETCFVEQRDAFSWSAGQAKYGLIFADPPYAILPQKALKIFDIVTASMAPNGLFIFEMPGGLELSDSRMVLIKRLGKGRNAPSVGVFSLKGTAIETY